MSEEEYFSAKAEFEKSFEDTYGVPFNRLRELATAEREGRVVVYDAKQGNEIYDIKNGYVRESKLNEIKLNRNGLKYVAWWGTFSPLDIGETVFMTRSEAERALAEKGAKE